MGMPLGQPLIAEMGASPIIPTLTCELKPSIYTFGSLIHELGFPAENILYVGNSIRSDVKGAKAAGMQTAYIAPRWRLLLKKLPKEADFSFINYRKLQKYVLK